MKNFLLALSIGIFSGGIAGFATGIFVFPYWFPPPPVNELVPDGVERQAIATGRFIHADPSDPVHYGKGSMTVYHHLLHLEADFEVGPGPKYHVYLVPLADVTVDTHIQDTMFVDLGRLKAFSGSQNYTVPDGVDLHRFGAVVIWCEQFGTLISPAVMQFSP